MKGCKFSSGKFSSARPGTSIVSLPLGSIVQKTIRDSTYIILLVWDVVFHRDIYFPKESTPQWEPDTSDQVASTHKCEEVARSLQHQNVPSKAESPPLRHQSIEVIAADQSLRIKMIERRKKTNKLALFAGKISRNSAHHGLARDRHCKIFNRVDHEAATVHNFMSQPLRSACVNYETSTHLMYVDGGHKTLPNFHKMTRINLPFPEPKPKCNPMTTVDTQTVETDSLTSILLTDRARGPSIEALSHRPQPSQRAERLLQLQRASRNVLDSRFCR
ncbi:uncharacterized protein K489DRAFT_425101 [Dissoconium aciculare CBS 342.82]|uniref:Uncharacterized protein n=1 Tax=Dissoconium aciculare CBS 342.82 TaxID=1314786 RepID=A0A6J3M584_9PEZI|nr:uncharacterized protein K489DRAFT_425101 [Dissoconium aciculare CBS 342.82]KAF1823210.1 hypothetical protein K489DRAFT_425101 [Dissoconium aciculare CBS 342.82]